MTSHCYRYHDKNKVTFRLELKLGDINEVKDTIECVQQLLIKLSHGFNNVKIGNNGDAHVTLDEFNNTIFSSGDDNNQSLATNKLFLLKFYLIGDIKGVFQILGRNGYDSSYCMFCKCRTRKWKDKHSASSGIHA